MLLEHTIMQTLGDKEVSEYNGQDPPKIKDTMAQQ